MSSPTDFGFNFPSNGDRFDQAHEKFKSAATYVFLLWIFAVLAILLTKGVIIFCIFRWYTNRHSHRQPPTTISAQPVVPGCKYLVNWLLVMKDMKVILSKGKLRSKSITLTFPYVSH